MTQNPSFGPCSPFFIVRSVEDTLAFYVDKLGFSCRFRSDDDPLTFAVVGRGAAQLMVKSIGDELEPLPNPCRHPWARWDAFIYLDDPYHYGEELLRRGIAATQPTQMTDDGLEGFALTDPDGYVCFFGRPGEG